MTLHKITEFYTKYFSVCLNRISKFRNTATFKRKANDSNKTCMSMIFHCAKLYLSKCNGSHHKTWILNFNRPTCSYFSFFSRESDLIKSCSSPENLSECKIAWLYVDWYKFFTHLRSLNVRHFGMVAATVLKLWRRCHLKWLDLPTGFRKKSTSKFKSWCGDRHTDRIVISLAYIFPSGRKVGQKRPRRRNGDNNDG
jgi:hypothetical protein